MKNKMKYEFENFKYMISSEIFKLILLFIIIATLYGTFYLTLGSGYVSGFLTMISNGYYNMLIFIIILLNTINLYKIFEKNNLYIIRFKTKKEYLKKLISNTLFSNGLILLLIYIFAIIGLNVFCSSSSGIGVIEKYNMINWIYLIFYIIRSFVLIQIISVINILLLKIIDSKLLLLLNFLLYGIIISYPYAANIEINTAFNIPLFIGEYFTLYKYEYFTLELLCSTLYIGLLILIIGLLFNVVERFMKQVGE